MKKTPREPGRMLDVAIFYTFVLLFAVAIIAFTISMTINIITGTVSVWINH